MNRSRPDIYASILKFTAKNNDGIGITKLMYGTFLSYKQLRQSVKELTKSNLLSYEQSSKKYRVTRKGLSFVVMVEKLNELLEAEN